MDADEQFFYEHAGWSYRRGGETPERYARDHGWWADVVPDPDVKDDDVDSVGMVARGEAVNLSVTLYAPREGNPVIRARGNVLGALSGIVVPSEDDPYLRVVAAELASEAMR